MRSFKSNENIHKKEGGPHHAAPTKKATPATPQSPPPKPEETHYNPANFKQAVDSKTDINQNGVQINKNLSRI